MTSLDDTSRLIQLACAGRADAFRQLLDAHYGIIFRMAFRLCGHREDAEDITQMTCLKIAQTLDRFRGDAQFTTWVYTITLNTYRDWVRVKANNAKGHADIDALAERLPASGDTPEALMVRREQMERVYALPLAEREAVMLVFGEGLSHRQAADVLGCAESTISWRIMEARKKLAGERGR